MKTVLMTAALLLPGGIVLALVIWLWDRTPENRVSDAWLANQRRER